jgi:hypothetical protein
MGSLEDKVARLSPEQRREVENFVDFIGQKYTNGEMPSSKGEFFHGSKGDGLVNPVILAEEKPVPIQKTTTDPLPVMEDRRMDGNSSGRKDSPPRLGRSKGKDPGLLLDWID